MYVVELVAWALVHVGALYLVTEAAILSPVRRILTSGLPVSSLVVALLYCPGCCGFWLGLLEGALGLVVFPEPYTPSWVTETEPHAWILDFEGVRIVLTGLAGMGLGAWWGAQRRDSLGLMFSIEQGWKTPPPGWKDHDDDGEATSEERPGGERSDARDDTRAAPGSSGGVSSETDDDADRPHGDG